MPQAILTPTQPFIITQVLLSNILNTLGACSSFKVSLYTTPQKHKVLVLCIKLHL